MRGRDWRRLLDAQERRADDAVDRARNLSARLDEAERLIEKLAKPDPGLGFVRVHQDEGKPTIEGVLVAREPRFILKNAALIEAEGRTIDLDGAVEILREHIGLVQQLGTLEPSAE